MHARPKNTYRLQINVDFTLDRAAELLPQLRELGVDWVYLSPILASEPGSDHGYDVVDHSRVDPARGGAEGLARLSAAAHELGMGVLVDIVPNHVGVATPEHSLWWWQLLREGPNSPRAASFDVDWEAGDGRIRLPIVGDDDLPRTASGEVDVDGPIANLQVDGDRLRYHDNSFPLAEGTAGLGDANAVHDAQHYRLVHWRTADDQLNYRRFFAVNELAAVRVEDPEVFAESHAEIKRWFDEGLVDGLRVDHPDGLRDPEGYLRDLAELTGGAYVLVEKILEPGEELPRWACAGTTGYDALAMIDRLFVDPAGQAPLDALETELRGAPVDWHQLVHDRKRAVADGILGSEVRRIVRELPEALTAELTPAVAIDAVAELLSCFAVYRSYLPIGREYVDGAFADARGRRPELGPALDLLYPVLSDAGESAALRFQQTSGMVMAKGVEDCAFYRTSRLTSLNEVGADPSIFAVSAEEFHAWARRRQAEWPDAMTCMSTHDTKRGEDVRARITALAEIPERWSTALRRLLELVPVPDAGMASLLWQAVLGDWGSDADEILRVRLHGYAEKAMREAAEGTAWTAVNEPYEQAMHDLIDAAFDRAEVRAVLDELAAQVAGPGWSNGLGAKLVALTIPGVPDVYQGSELWEQSLVDPDNRRPVDHEERAELLAALPEDPALPEAPLQDDVDDSGVEKLEAVRFALTLRRDRPELFTTHDPVTAEGPAADYLFGFDRGGAITLVTRLPIGLAERGGWGETSLELPAGQWRDQLTGAYWQGRVAVGEVFADLPVALLVREER